MIHDSSQLIALALLGILLVGTAAGLVYAIWMLW